MLILYLYINAKIAKAKKQNMMFEGMVNKKKGKAASITTELDPSTYTKGFLENSV